MNIVDFLSEKGIIEITSKDMEGAMLEVASILSEEINGILKPEEIRAQIREEGTDKSTVAPGVLIPHLRAHNVSGIGVKGVLGRSKEGVKGVHIIFMLISDDESAHRFVRALALLSNFFGDRKNYNSILKAKDRKEIYEILSERGNE